MAYIDKTGKAQTCHKYTVCKYKYKYKYLGGKYKYKYKYEYKYLESVLELYSSTSTSTKYYISGKAVFKSVLTFDYFFND